VADRATITKRGQVSIPARIRKQLKLKAGQTVRFRADPVSRTIQMFPEEGSKRNVDEAYGFMKKHGLEKKGLSSTADWMRLLRGED
jgi:AbrB family looped-hinge helix DNA binding protein